MPRKNETYPVQGHDAETLMILTVGTFHQLGWELAYAGNNIVTGYTINKWKRRAEQINVKSSENQMEIESRLTHGESFDLAGRNKKHINEFIAAFEIIKQSHSEEQITEWKTQLDIITQTTIKVVAEEAKQMAEIDKVMNLSGGSRTITYAIIAINAIVFIMMAINGISIFQPSGIDIIKWGANYAPLTLSGDWWRLLTCVFVHIGIIHILFNMYALFSIGMYLEPMLGKIRYTAAYLCTGVCASIASLWWHEPPVPSAGASGAIFGLYGVFLALLTTNIIPKQVRKSLLQSIGIFVGYNLLYGLKSGVDNAAHMGGLISGISIGYIYYFTLKAEKDAPIRRALTPAIIILTLVVSIFYLETKKVNASGREAIIKEIDQAKYTNAEKFDEKYNEIIKIQDSALAPFFDTLTTMEMRTNRLTETSLPAWQKAKAIAEELKKMTDISPAQKKKAEVIEQYINAREEEIGIFSKMVKDNSFDRETVLPQDNELQLIRNKIDSIVSTLNGL